MKQVNLLELSTYLSSIYKEIGYYYSNEVSDWMDDIRNMENNAEEINEDINVDGNGEMLKEFNFPIYKGDKCIRPCIYFKETYLNDGTVETLYYLSTYDYNKYIKE
jgi:hypothetical protein